MLTEKLGSSGPIGDSPDHKKPISEIGLQRQTSFYGKRAVPNAGRTAQGLDGVVAGYHNGCKVDAGFYWNKPNWSIETVSGKAGGVLPGERDQYVRLPAPAMLVAAPLMGMAYVIYLPSVGLAMAATQVAKKAASVMQEAYANIAPVAVEKPRQKTKRDHRRS